MWIERRIEEKKRTHTHTLLEWTHGSANSVKEVCEIGKEEPKMNGKRYTQK